MHSRSLTLCRSWGWSLGPGEQESKRASSLSEALVRLSWGLACLIPDSMLLSSPAHAAPWRQTSFPAQRSGPSSGRTKYMQSKEGVCGSHRQASLAHLRTPAAQATFPLPLVSLCPPVPAFLATVLASSQS